MSASDAAQRRAFPAMVAVGACAVLTAASAATGLFQLTVLGRVSSGGQVSENIALLSDGLSGGIGLLQMLAMVIAAVLWLRWLHAAYGGLRTIGLQRTELTAGWAVGYWFIPIINLFRPYRIVSELWHRSLVGNANETVPKEAPSVVSSWWSLWLLSNVAGQAATRLQLKADTPSELLGATVASLVVDVVTVASGVLAVKVVQKVSGFQRSWAVQRAAA